MKAYELRIGNYVLDRGNKILRIDYWECKDKVAQDMGNYFCEPFGLMPYHPLTEEVEFLKPIQLTEEWLLKFNWNGYNPLHFNRNFEIDKQGRLYCNGDYKGVNVNYIHQLQNLYFALTQTELTLNQPQ